MTLGARSFPAAAKTGPPPANARPCSERVWSGDEFSHLFRLVLINWQGRELMSRE